MPLLNVRNLPVSPSSVAVERVRKQLADAVGLEPRLFLFVNIANDAALNDAITGHQLEANCPCGFLSYQTSLYNTDGHGNNAVWCEVAVSLYVLYYVGTGNAPGMIRSNFTDARDRHIRWAIEHLKDVTTLPNNSVGFPRSAFIDANNVTFWRFAAGGTFTVDNDQPFRYLDQTQEVALSTGFTCSRVDFSILVRNHANFS